MSSSTARAQAEHLVRARVWTAHGDALARQLEGRGVDVVEGSVTSASLDVIGSRNELGLLTTEGLAVDIVQEGRPLRQPPPIVPQNVSLLVAPGYQDYETLVGALEQECQRFPDICQVVDITAAYGNHPTFEGRHIFGARISDHVASDEDEPAVLLVSAHHAREINAPVVVMQAMSSLLEGYGLDPAITIAVDELEIWVVPVWNPDGYDYVFSTDNLWRKNRRPVEGAVGVDLNRNYSFGWNATCSGSTDPGQEAYKGPSPASEAETQTMVDFSASERFAKVLDVHSFGRQVLSGYHCLSNPLAQFQEAEASAIAVAAGYAASATRPPASEGEHEEFEFAMRGAFAFLIEVGKDFQPPIESAQTEAVQVWPAVLGLLKRPASVTGHVRDACTGLPIDSTIVPTDIRFTNGERNGSGGPFGRYDLFLPAGNHELAFSAESYVGASFPVEVNDSRTTALEVMLMPVAGCGDSIDGGVADSGAETEDDSGPSGGPDLGGDVGTAAAADGTDSADDSAETTEAREGGLSTEGTTPAHRPGGCGCRLAKTRSDRWAPFAALALLAFVSRRRKPDTFQGQPSLDPSQGSFDGARALGVYVHFPYCGSRCPYCDFAVAVRPSIPHEEYADAVLAELALRAPWFKAASSRQPVSIYFGGGTPGLWQARALGRVLLAVQRTFGVEGDAEITVEANPGDLDRSNLADLRALGVNRLSFGAQAFQDRLLSAIGRGHDAAAIPAAFAAARAAGFDNLCADLMFGLPGQSMDDWQASLAALVELGPEHITAYALTVEQNTRFGALARAGQLARPGDDEVAAMYSRGHEFLVATGYEHYEISSYARPGRRSVHNTLYWTMGAYLGLGVSASSFRPLVGGEGWRFTNTRSPQSYLHSTRSAAAPFDLVELRSSSQVEDEALWLGLRMSDGVDRQAHAIRYGRDPLQPAWRKHAAEGCAEAGWLDITPEKLRLLPAGFLFADEVAVRLLGK